MVNESLITVLWLLSTSEKIEIKFKTVKNNVRKTSKHST